MQRVFRLHFISGRDSQFCRRKWAWPQITDSKSGNGKFSLRRGLWIATSPVSFALSPSSSFHPRTTRQPKCQAVWATQRSSSVFSPLTLLFLTSDVIAAGRTLVCRPGSPPSHFQMGMPTAVSQLPNLPPDNYGGKLWAARRFARSAYKSTGNGKRLLVSKTTCRRPMWRSCWCSSSSPSSAWPPAELCRPTPASVSSRSLHRAVPGSTCAATILTFRKLSAARWPLWRIDRPVRSRICAFLCFTTALIMGAPSWCCLQTVSWTFGITSAYGQCARYVSSCEATAPSTASRATPWAMYGNWSRSFPQ